MLNREHAGHIEWGQQHRVCWSCVSELEVVLISSGVDVFLSAEKLNSSSAEQETDNTPITTPLNIGVAGGLAGPALAGPSMASTFCSGNKFSKR